MESREWVEDTRHSADVHEDLREADPALSAWLIESVSRIRSMPAIGQAQVPDPKDPQLGMDVGFLDPSTVFLLVAHAELRGAIASGLYIGLVAQDLDCSWRGLSGFYLPWCPGCDPQGRDAVDSVRARAASLGLDFVSERELPRALHSAPGWFQGRLVGGAAVGARPGLSPTWEAVHGEICGPALVRFGASLTSLANIVAVNEAGEGLTELEGLTSRGAWTARWGTQDALRTIADVGSGRVRTGMLRRLSNLPGGWTAFRVVNPQGEIRSIGLTHSLELSLRRGQSVAFSAARGDVIHYANLVVRGAADCTEVLRLPELLRAYTPA